MKRKKFQGLLNVVRFNYSKYLAASLIGILGLFFLLSTEDNTIQLMAILSQTSWLVILSSLIASYWVYDRSNLYDLKFLENELAKSKTKIINIHAGFNEIGEILNLKYPNAERHHFNIYPALSQKEKSIQIAERQGSSCRSIELRSFQIPLKSNLADLTLLFFAAHEIRNPENRLAFFKEIKRVQKKGGQVFITEHHRDLANFMAYNFGFFHFYTKKTWQLLFIKSGFQIVDIVKQNPWVSTYKLECI